MVAAISPGIIKEVNTQKSAFSSRANIEMFLQACEKLGLSQAQLFNVEDLFSGTKIRSVAVTIHWLAYVAGQMNLDLPPFDPMHLSRMSLPSDQKQKLVVKKPRASQYISNPIKTPETTQSLSSTPKAAPSSSNQSKPVSAPAPAPTPTVQSSNLPEYDDYPTAPDPTNSMDELDAMLDSLETEAKYQAPPQSSRQPTNNVPTINTPTNNNNPAPSAERASVRTPNSPVVHRNAPPRWNDNSNSNPAQNNEPNQQRRAAPDRNNANQPSSTQNPPVWQDTAKNDPNLTHCDDCKKEIILGQSAYAHSNGTYCRLVKYI